MNPIIRHLLDHQSPPAAGALATAIAMHGESATIATPAPVWTACPNVTESATIIDDHDADPHTEPADDESFVAEFAKLLTRLDSPEPETDDPFQIQFTFE